MCFSNVCYHMLLVTGTNLIHFSHLHANKLPTGIGLQSI